MILLMHLTCISIHPSKTIYLQKSLRVLVLKDVSPLLVQHMMKSTMLQNNKLQMLVVS